MGTGMLMSEPGPSVSVSIGGDLYPLNLNILQGLPQGLHLARYIIHDINYNNSYYDHYGGVICPLMNNVWFIYNFIQVFR